MANAPFSQGMDAHPISEAWLLMKLLVCWSAVGARHVVPLQLRHHHTVATFIEFAMDFPQICEQAWLIPRATDGTGDAGEIGTRYAI